MTVSPGSLVQRARDLRGGDEGSAIVEFCFLGVLLLLPLTYVLLAVLAVQDSAYAVTAATREAGRAYVTSEPSDDAGARALAAARIALADHGLTIDAADLRLECSAADCREPGGTVSVSLARRVALPFVPALFGRAPASVRVSATHLELVDRFRQTRP